MYPDREYADARGSYGSPVPVPPMDPDASPTFTVSVNCFWLAYIRGALQQLLLQATWATDDPAVLLLAQQRAFTLIAMFEECVGILPFACSYDLTLAVGPFQITDQGVTWTPEFVGQWVNAVGIVGLTATTTTIPGGEFNYIDCFMTFASTLVTTVSMTYDLVKGAFNTATVAQSGIILLNGGVQVGVLAIVASTDPDGTGKVLTYSTGGITCDEIRLLVWSEYANGVSVPGSVTITSVDVDGIGATPC